MLSLSKNSAAFAWMTCRGILRHRYCVNCKHCKPVMKSGSIEVEKPKDGKYERIMQTAPGYGCLISDEKHRDYITGRITRILRNCKDNNPRGECKHYRRKWWKIWTT